MNCWSARRRMHDYLDSRLRAGERSRLEAHCNTCDSCSVAVEQFRLVRGGLRSLPEPAAPARLDTDLHVASSRARQEILATHGARWKAIWYRWKFRLNEFMRPLTIPATGGLISSLMLFGALAFTIGTTSQIVSYEVPVLYSDQVDANLVPVELRSSVMLTLSLDGSGRITDYSVRDGASSFTGDPSRLQTGNIALPAFPNVLAMAQPITGDVSILFRPIVFRQ